MHPSFKKPLLCLSLALALSACSGLNTSKSNTDTAPAGSGSQAETYENPNYYYLFDDILIPNGMEHTPDDEWASVKRMPPAASRSTCGVAIRPLSGA